ncbi:MAG TPA: hypothetical protein VF171_05755, partial [Trueperaceae bacterium]
MIDRQMAAPGGRAGTRSSRDVASPLHPAAGSIAAGSGATTAGKGRASCMDAVRAMTAAGWWPRES